jgi:Afadin- and alpha -actinin-Binding
MSAIARESPTFATLENWSSCVASLNRSLADKALPSNLVFTGLAPQNAANACNALYAVLFQLQRADSARNNAVEAQRRLLSELQRLEKALLNARAAADEARDETAAAVRREKAAAQEFAAKLTRLTAERDSAIKERNGFAFKLAQAQTEVKRRERDVEALSDKLRLIVVEGGRTRSASGRFNASFNSSFRPGMESEPVSPRVDTPRREDAADVTTDEPAAETVMYRSMAESLRGQLDASQAENRELCAALAVIRDDVRALREAVKAPPPPDNDEDGAAAGSDDENFAAQEAVSGGMLRNAGALPFTLGGGAIVARIRRDVRAVSVGCRPSTNLQS